MMNEGNDVKTLDEMIQISAEAMFNEYMGGGNPRASSASVLATVYGVSSQDVANAIWEKLEEVKTAYYNSPKVKALKI